MPLFRNKRNSEKKILKEERERQQAERRHQEQLVQENALRAAIHEITEFKRSQISLIIAQWRRVNIDDTESIDELRGIAQRIAYCRTLHCPEYVYGVDVRLTSKGYMSSEGQRLFRQLEYDRYAYHKQLELILININLTLGKLMEAKADTLEFFAAAQKYYNRVLADVNYIFSPKVSTSQELSEIYDKQAKASAKIHEINLRLIDPRAVYSMSAGTSRGCFTSYKQVGTVAAEALPRDRDAATARVDTRRAQVGRPIAPSPSSYV